MPLRDHFRPPLSEVSSWEEVHGQWPAVIVQHLGKTLPPQFTAKCAALLRQGVSLVLVDVVTARDVNLYADLLELIGRSDLLFGTHPPATYAVACRWRPRGTRGWLETWNQELKPSLPLPCMPLWLTEDLAIPLDLEASYEQTCSDLRIA